MIVTGQNVVDWGAARINPHGGWGRDAQGIGVMRDGNIIAAVIYTDYNGANVMMHVAAEPKSNWLSRYALWCFFDYPFNRMKVKRVTSTIGEGNTQSQKLCEGVGMKLETVLSDADMTGDLLVYVMRKADCRWLGKTPLRNVATEVGHHENKIAA